MTQFKRRRQNSSVYTINSKKESTLFKNNFFKYEPIALENSITKKIEFKYKISCLNSSCSYITYIKELSKTSQLHLHYKRIHPKINLKKIKPYKKGFSNNYFKKLVLNFLIENNLAFKVAKSFSFKLLLDYF